MPDAVEQRWIHHEKRRYYGVFLQQDLFGDWTLVKNWDSLDNGRGQLHRDALPVRPLGCVRSPRSTAGATRTAIIW